MGLQLVEFDHRGLVGFFDDIATLFIREVRVSVGSPQVLGKNKGLVPIYSQAAKLQTHVAPRYALYAMLRFRLVRGVFYLEFIFRFLYLLFKGYSSKILITETSTPLHLPHAQFGNEWVK